MANKPFTLNLIPMAKKSSIERNKRKQQLVLKYQAHRTILKQQIKVASKEATLICYKKLQSLPRNSAPTRVYRRCFITGRPRAVYRDFGLSRHVIREMAHACLLPGVTKSSW